MPHYVFHWWQIWQTWWPDRSERALESAGWTWWLRISRGESWRVPQCKSAVSLQRNRNSCSNLEQLSCGYQTTPRYLCGRRAQEQRCISNCMCRSQQGMKLLDKGDMLLRTNSSWRGLCLFKLVGARHAQEVVADNIPTHPYSPYMSRLQIDVYACAFWVGCGWHLLWDLTQVWEGVLATSFQCASDTLGKDNLEALPDEDGEGDDYDRDWDFDGDYPGSEVFELKGTEELAMDYDVFGKFVKSAQMEKAGVPGAKNWGLTSEDCLYLAADGKPTWWFWDASGGECFYAQSDSHIPPWKGWWKEYSEDELEVVLEACKGIGREKDSQARSWSSGGAWQRSAWIRGNSTNGHCCLTPCEEEVKRVEQRGKKQSLTFREVQEQQIATEIKACRLVTFSNYGPW